MRRARRLSSEPERGLIQLEADRSTPDVAAKGRRRTDYDTGHRRVGQILMTRTQIVVQVLGPESPPRQAGPIDADAGGPAHHPLRRRGSPAEPGRPAGLSGENVGD